MLGEPTHELVAMADPDPAWGRIFHETRALLAMALGPAARRLDHVGSTAVPGLAAKPVIDVQVSVPDVDDESAYRDAIERLGFPTGHRTAHPDPRLHDR